MKYILIILFILGLVYVLIPGPGTVDQFPPLPNSVKSTEPGDTFQVPNLAAYFSDFDRQGITGYYRKEFARLHLFGFIPPVVLNYPPKDAYQYVRDQQFSTFLEEYVYPLHESVYVTGYEPFVDGNIRHMQHSFIADHIHVDGRYFVSKTVLRLYPTFWFVRLIIYLGICISLVALFRVFKESLKEKN